MGTPIDPASHITNAKIAPIAAGGTILGRANNSINTISASGSAAPHPDEPLLLRAEAAHYRFRTAALESYARILIMLCKERGIDVPPFPDLEALDVRQG